MARKNKKDYCELCEKPKKGCRVFSGVGYKIWVCPKCLKDSKRYEKPKKGANEVKGALRKNPNIISEGVTKIGFDKQEVYRFIVKAKKIEDVIVELKNIAYEKGWVDAGVSKEKGKFVVIFKNKIQENISKFPHDYETTAKSDSSDKVYNVVKKGDYWSCTCPAYIFTKKSPRTCKHILKIQAEHYIPATPVADVTGWSDIPISEKVKMLRVAFWDLTPEGVINIANTPWGKISPDKQQIIKSEMKKTRVNPEEIMCTTCGAISPDGKAGECQFCGGTSWRGSRESETPRGTMRQSTEIPEGEQDDGDTDLDYEELESEDSKKEGKSGKGEESDEEGEGEESDEEGEGKEPDKEGEKTDKKGKESNESGDEEVESGESNEKGKGKESDKEGEGETQEPEDGEESDEEGEIGDGTGEDGSEESGEQGEELDEESENEGSLSGLYSPGQLLAYEFGRNQKEYISAFKYYDETTNQPMSEGNNQGYGTLSAKISLQNNKNPVLGRVKDVNNQALCLGDLVVYTVARKNGKEQAFKGKIVGFYGETKPAGTYKHREFKLILTPTTQSENVVILNGEVYKELTKLEKLTKEKLEDSTILILLEEDFNFVYDVIRSVQRSVENMGGNADCERAFWEGMKEAGINKEWLKPKYQREFDAVSAPKRKENILPLLAAPVVAAAAPMVAGKGMAVAGKVGAKAGKYAARRAGESAGVLKDSISDFSTTLRRKMKWNPFSIPPGPWENPALDANTIDGLYNGYLDTYEWVCEEVKKQTGKYPIKRKKLDDKYLYKFFNTLQYKNLNGFEFISKLLSSLLVKHVSPNTNHRTSLTFVNAILKQNGFDLNFVIGKDKKRFETFINGSKQILKNRKNTEHYDIKHLEYTTKQLNTLLGNQSGKLARISAISFIDSFKHSSNGRGYFGSNINKHNTSSRIKTIGQWENPRFIIGTTGKIGKYKVSERESSKLANMFSGTFDMVVDEGDIEVELFYPDGMIKGTVTCHAWGDDDKVMVVSVDKQLYIVTDIYRDPTGV